MNRTLTAIAAEKDAGRKLKYFVRGDMGVSYGQFASLKQQNGLLVNGAPVHANHLLRASYLAMRNVAECILQHGRSQEADGMCLPIADVLTLIPEE